MKRKICFVTGSRADYSHLYPLLLRIKNDPSLQLQLIVTGTHLSAAFGATYKKIEADGFFIDKKIKISLGNGSALDVAKFTGQATQAIAKELLRLQPDFVVIFGDRYEMLAFAQAALILKIPAAHIGGGDTTEGAFDESIRHSITKMSHLHFVTNKAAAQRVCRMGENPKRVFNTGSLIIEQIHKTQFLSRSNVEKQLHFKMREKNLLITFHPVTLDQTSSSVQLNALLKALALLPETVGLIFTSPNADTEGLHLADMIRSFAAQRTNACFMASLGSQLYFSVLKESDAVVGNSSSGIYEAPSFKIPTVNIGDRQKGRPQAISIINCKPKTAEISRAINSALRTRAFRVKSLYGNGHSSKKIHHVLKTIKNPQAMIKKQFWGVVA